MKCLCGCGLEVTPDSRNRPRKYIKGHNKPWLGKSRSEATKEKIRKSLLGRKLSKETKDKIRLAHLGKRPKNSLNWKGKNHPRWNGGRHKSTYGYILIYAPNHPYRDCHGYIFEHRLIMEKKLGRYLKTDEIVHHANGIKTDNRIENLELVLSRSEHKKIHSEIGLKTRFK